VTEQVEVQANATLVETRSVGVGQVVENARILELPLNGRAVVELLALSGAATPALTVTGSNRDPFSRGNVSVAGGLSTGLNYTLDGANHNNQYSGSYLSMPFPDALQEFKVETSATSAQSGVKSSGTVSLVTKSGTNEIHGDLFEFVRNGKFNARNVFATRRDSIKRNQYGGTVGGPIAKNKLFFFAGYQGTKIRQDPPDSLAFVPTPAMLAGDFTAFASAACNTQYARWPVEPEHPKTDRCRVAGIGELSWKRYPAFVGHATHQSCDLPSGRPVHAEWSPIQSVLFDR
jgi:hypothetical protein